jgi:hypothetical protein
MSIGAIVNVKGGPSLDVRDRQDIYWMRGFAKMIEELDAENNRGRQELQRIFAPQCSHGTARTFAGSSKYWGRLVC